jgi:mannose-1-phosphate guanylyltransferase
MRIKEAMDKPGEQEAIREIYETMEKGPTEDVTRHLMDSGEAIVLLLPFRNTDVGTWESVREFSADDQENDFDASVVGRRHKWHARKVKKHRQAYRGSRAQGHDHSR